LGGAADAIDARGQRESYRPVRSSLAATSEPVAIARALVAACAAQQVPLGGAAQQVPLGGAAQQVPLGGAAQQVPLGGAAQPVPLASAAQPVPAGGAPKQVPAGCGANTLYVADLGAILRRGADHNDPLRGALQQDLLRCTHAATLAALLAALPGVTIWVDAGFDGYAAMRVYFDAVATATATLAGSVTHARPAASSSNAVTTGTALPSSPVDAASLRTRLVPVFGTESLRDTNALREAERDGYAPILSLDRRAGQPLTATVAIEDRPECWPRRVISMTLDHVGSYAGPDLATLARLSERAPRGTQLIGAGGIRNRDDLRLARSSGAHAWLVASALHDRRLDEPAVA